MSILQEHKDSLEGKLRIKKYILLGDPIPWARAGTNKGRYYDKQKHLKLVVQAQLMQQHESFPLFDGPVAVKAEFHMRMPARWSERKKREMEGKPHYIKPDTSNLIKFYEDCCSKIVYQDDCQIAQEELSKFYAREPKVVLYIRLMK